MENIKFDLFNRIPQIGDILIFNPPVYKGLVFGSCIGFTNNGNPKVNNLSRQDYPMKGDLNSKGFYSIKTQFAIK